jgi:FMN reductase
MPMLTECTNSLYKVIFMLIIATSLDSDSRSQILARLAQAEAQSLGIEANILDLRQHDLPLAGSKASWNHPETRKLKAMFAQEQRFLFALPIYNYDVNAAAKNLVELMGSDVLEDSMAGFICTAGGRSSYMSVMGFANSLMFDFRTWIVPRFVYVIDNEWQGDELKSTDQRQRIRQLVETLHSGPSGGLPIATKSLGFDYQ